MSPPGRSGGRLAPLAQPPYLGGFGITGIVVIIDAVLFALYYRAVVHNANEVIAAEAVAR